MNKKLLVLKGTLEIPDANLSLTSDKMFLLEQNFSNEVDALVLTLDQMKKLAKYTMSLVDGPFDYDPS
jgi:hypothetical protein